MNRSSQLRARRQKFLKMILGCAGVLVLLSTPAIAAGPKKDKDALIDCMKGTFDSLEQPSGRNEVHQGYKIKWNVYGPGGEDWKVHIDFVTKEGVACLGVSPLDNSSPIQETIKNGFVKIDPGPP